ncbi:uclacyanin 1-like [Durio zibethinus]|uniref:Uclacyanin 1-like n=1 Tax=Durio zibethinus TaxID=66656 RepID=A0A6P5ZGP7_DURZI|nr:uclacyanin 1-like [Durio zibethinus]
MKFCAVFNFPNGAYDVARVTRANFNACYTGSPLLLLSNSPANVTFNETGDHYFLCAFTGHCYAGQKLKINVSAAASSPAPQPSTSAPQPSSPSPQPTTSPPASAPQPSALAPAPQASSPTATPPSSPTPSPSTATPPSSNTTPTPSTIPSSP